MEQFQKVSLKILDTLKNSPHGMSITEIARIIHKNKHSVGRYLEVLQVSGQVEMRMFGKAKVFSASNRIPLELLMNFSREFILILDSDYRVLHVNNYFLDLIKTTREAIIGKNCFYISFSLPSSSQTILDSIQSCIKSGIPETEIIVGNEIKKTYLLRIISIVFNEGTKGTAISIENITDRKNAMFLEQKYNFLLDLISDSTHLGILIVRNKSVIFANKPIERLFGPCLKTPLHYLMENIVPEERGRISKMFLEPRVGLRKTYEITFGLEGASRSRIIVKGRIGSFDEADGVSCFLLVNDISG
jgi:PAS domain-containing protein